MRVLLAVPLLFAACASAPPIVDTVRDEVVRLPDLGQKLAEADVVVLGEMHGMESIHRTHHSLIAEIHSQRPNMVIAMEMFERDIQNELLQYLAGLIDEATFLEQSRPWRNYKTDYRPVIEFAKENGIVVLAANAPRDLARKVAAEGIESVAGNENVARETTTPKDAYWDAFVKAMGDHGGVGGDDAMERFYAAQCLKDDTMAESICDHLAKHDADNRPLAILICGRMHSDYRRGTVQRILDRMPELGVRVLSAELVDTLESNIYASPREIADYVIVTAEQPLAPTLPPARTKAPTKEHEGKGEGHDEQPEADEHEGMRPALGFMPGYGATDPGVLVESVREGGPAAKGGLKEGDVITELAGTPVEDITDYTEVLDELKIGSKVAVLVKRGDSTLYLDVVIGSRPGR